MTFLVIIHYAEEKLELKNLTKFYIQQDLSIEKCRGLESNV